jgi:CHAT domain-containing protein/tetratricopeptide (TPR) repeat protein
VLYGDGIPDPHIDYDGALLQQLISRLTEEGFYFEAFELLENFVEDCKPGLEVMASSLLAENNLASTACLIRLAAIHGRNEDIEEAKGLLDLIDQLLPDDLQLPKIQCELISQRFCDTDASTLDRVQRLLNFSHSLLDLGDYNKALQALEYAAELESMLFGPGQTREYAAVIHAQLQVVCEQSKDHLSQLLFRFRHCDVISSVGGDIKASIQERDAVLSVPFCTRLPYFQKYHRRQWIECFTLRQRENALHHASMYSAYCKSCKSAEEQSLADNMILQTKIQPARMSVEARESMLERVVRSLKDGIEIAKANEWFLSQVEKQLLLVEVLEELGRIQEEEHAEIVKVVTGILDDAATASERVEWKGGIAYLRFEISILRQAAFDPLQDAPVNMTDRSGVSPLERDISTVLQPETYFRRAQSFQELVLAIRNESLPVFQRLFRQVCQYTDGLDGSEDSLKLIELLNFKGMMYYLLMEFETTTIKQFWKVVGFDSLLEGAEMALCCFEEASKLNDKFITDQDDAIDRLGKLAAGQSYSTNSHALLIHDIAIELTFGLQDKNRTWAWIQRSKARALSRMLKNPHVPSLPTLGAGFNLSESLTYENLQYMQTASARKLIFVDWISFGINPRKLLCFSFSMGRDETGPIAECNMEEIPTPMEELEEAARRITDARMDRSDASQYLLPFIPILQPLSKCSDPGNILLLSLTAPLHAVPFHAVQLGSHLSLIERNPVVYVPSHSALLSCLQRLSAPNAGDEVPALWRAAVLGAYDDDKVDSESQAERNQIYNGLKDLALNLGTEAVTGLSLTKATFEQLSSQANLLHFHGHGLFDAYKPEQTSLILGSLNEIMTLPSLAALNMQSSHVTLIACSGAVQDFSLSGDEPLGLPSALLLGGASSVLGALWPIQSTTGRLFTHIFYDYFLNYVDRSELGPIVNLAVAIQHTVLEIRKHPAAATPYHWAPFVLYGVWFCGRKPGSW